MFHYSISLFLCGVSFFVMIGYDDEEKNYNFFLITCDFLVDSRFWNQTKTKKKSLQYIFFLINSDSLFTSIFFILLRNVHKLSSLSSVYISCRSTARHTFACVIIYDYESHQFLLSLKWRTWWRFQCRICQFYASKKI